MLEGRKNTWPPLDSLPLYPLLLRNGGVGWELGWRGALARPQRCPCAALMASCALRSKPSWHFNVPLHTPHASLHVNPPPQPSSTFSPHIFFGQSLCQIHPFFSFSSMSALTFIPAAVLFNYAAGRN